MANTSGRILLDSTGDIITLQSATVSWLPYAGVHSYKLFYTELGASSDPYVAPDSVRNASITAQLFTHQTDAITGTSVNLLSVLPITNNTTRSFSLYLFGYSDSRGQTRVTGFPTLRLSFVLKSIYQKIVLQRTTYGTDGGLTFLFVDDNSSQTGQSQLIEQKSFTP